MLPRLRQWTRGRLLSSLFHGSTHAEQAANFEEIVEGSARALYEKGQVFYNPVQVVNRDLSVQVLRWFVRERGPDAPPIRILEALSASGLRSIRYFNEVPNVGCVVANDMDPNAVETIRRNILYNGLSTENIIPNIGDAIEVLTLARGRDKQYDVIDLDPYGSAAPFLDSAVQAVADGGILAITCTDLPVLCGNSPEICFGRYAGTPLKGPSGHEMAVRIVLGAIQRAANRHGRAVEALLCAKIDFYVRLFVRVRNSKFLAQQTPSQLALVFQCSSCNTQRIQPLGRIRTSAVSKTVRKKRRTSRNASGNKEDNTANGNNLQGDASSKPAEVRKYTPPLIVEHISSCCNICGGSMMLGGPIWTGRLIVPEMGESILQDLSKKEQVFKARSRVEAIIRLLCEEVRDAPLFLQLPAMCRILKVSAPPSASVRSFISSKGYEVSQSHTDPQALKTNAPPELLWDILKVWVQKVGNPFTNSNKKEDDTKTENGKADSKKTYDVGAKILGKPPVLVKSGEVDFSVKKDKYVRRSSAAPTAPRYPLNPTPNWGPKARAGKRQREIL